MAATDLNRFAVTRAVWRGDRIMHVRAYAFAGPARLRRFGVRTTKGYVKCGSGAIPDWVTALRVLAWDGAKWRVALEQSGLGQTKKDQVKWFDLDGLETTALQIEATDCGVDGGWTGWNLVSNAFTLEGEAPERSVASDTLLELLECKPDRNARLLPGQVRFKSRHMEVGFGLGRAGFRHLGVDDEGQGRTGLNLLQAKTFHSHMDPPEAWTQGLRLHAVGAPQAVGVFQHNVRGSVAVRGQTVTYDLAIPEAGQRYKLAWEFGGDRLRLTAERVGEKPLRAWTSSAWQIAFDCTVAAVTNLARVTRVGEAGLVELPALLHAPGHGTWRVEAKGRAASWRADSFRLIYTVDSFRPIYTVTSELKLGEEAQPEGDYLLKPGRHRTEVEFAVTQHKPTVRRGTPKVVRRALNRCAITAMTYRPDTATFANNGNSVHAIICADVWAALTPVAGRLLPNLHARDLLRDTLVRHLNGGPSYAAGPWVHDGQHSYYEDQYVMSGTAFLLGVAESGLKWSPPLRRKLNAEIERMRRRDLDGDGLVESPYHLGISGQHQWSTSWFDAISFGWKDAFANALLYPALLKFGEKKWAAQLRASYWSTFYNEKTGWLAGWRCKENKLHDYGFLFVNGAAVRSGLVEKKPAREIIGRLWEELQRLGPPDYRMGLPGNLWNVPYKDMVCWMDEGINQNRALTFSQARHFVGALYQVGMAKEAETVLRTMLESFGDGTAFGGCGSGVDWRRWDGQPSGYEGLLSDQLGVLAMAMERYGKGRPKG